MESPAPVTLPTIHPNGTDATSLEAESEYREVAAQFALIKAADRIRSREGWSPAYRCAANASHAARDAVDRYRRATNA